MRIAAILLVVLLASPAIVCRADNEPLPTNDELQQLFKDGQYQPLLQKLSRVLQLKGDAARPYDKVKLLLLKGDTHLELKENSLAVAAYGAAVKAIDEHTDKRLAATAKATEQLVKRSRAFNFTPRTAPPGQAPKPISILDLSQRQACFAGMFEDAKADIATKIRAAKNAKTLLPIIDAVNAVADLRTLEIAAFNKEEQSAAQIDTLAGQAKELMGKAVKEMQDRSEKLNKRANEMVPVAAGTQGTLGTFEAQKYYKRGVDPQMGKELKGIVADCDKVAEAAKQFGELSKANADGFNEITTAAEKVGMKAKDTLTDDYSGLFAK